MRPSKKEANINFYEKQIIKTIDDSNIKNTKIKMPFYYVYGNNIIKKYRNKIRHTETVKLDKKKKEIEIIYFRLNIIEGDFIIEGELINKCKGEWIINLTNEEIDSLIHPDFKDNKRGFKKIALKIIKQYDEEHKDYLISFPIVTKIGKLIKKNIQYDITYAGKNDITETETYNSKKGVCHHITNLFNALMYSLGYQTLYILGYAVYKKTFSVEDTHAWSLVKLDGKWLPFDATWGIFSGKLPITHIFKQIGFKEKKLNLMIKYD